MKKLDKDLLTVNLLNHAHEYVDGNFVSGVVMIVHQEGKKVAEVCYGKTSPDGNTPISANSFFRIASMTKPITGIAAVKAQELGYFDIHDKIADYYPAFGKLEVGKLTENGLVSIGKPKNDMKIFNLLSHSSGLVPEDEIGLRQLSKFPPSAYENIEAMSKYASENTLLSFEPLGGTAYSSYAAFDTVARLIADKSGMPYPEFLRKYIFSPLGITDITYNPTAEQWSRMVAMCDSTEGRTRPVTVDMKDSIFEDFPLSYTCAGAGLAATPEAYCRIAEMLLGEGELDGVRVLSPESVRLIDTPYVPAGTPGLGDTESWGLGCRVVTKTSVLPVGTFGWSGAYGTHFWVDPVNRITAILMRNNRWYDAHGCGMMGVNLETDVMNSLV